MAVLKIVNGPRAGATFRLGERMLTIGRATTNLIQVVDDRVSRRHAMIRWTGSGYLIVDLRSANGLRINGERQADATLTTGDRIHIGDTEFRVCEDTEAAADGVLDRKEVNPALVNRATVVSQTLANVEQLLAAGTTVPVDDIHEIRDVLVHKFLLEISLAATRQTKLAFKKSLSGVVDFVQPDRCLLLRLDGNKAKALARYVSEKVPDAFRSTPPFLRGLKPVIQERRAYLYNELSTLPDVQTPLGSVAAAPILDGDRILGLVYADSFGANCQPFIDDDLELFEGVAKALRPAFLRG